MRTKNAREVVMARLRGLGSHPSPAVAGTDDDVTPVHPVSLNLVDELSAAQPLINPAPMLDATLHVTPRF